MTTKAYSYIRFSSPEQAKGRSHERQLEACKKYCLQHGLELAQDEEYTFFDGGLSAYKAEHIGENGQLARFLRLVDEGSIPKGSYLIVESLDRLSRERINDALRRFMALLDSGINIVTLSDGMLYKTDYSTQDLILSIFVMSRAHEESSIKSKRVGDAWLSKQNKARQELKPIGGAAPLWLRLVDGAYQPIPERADIVARVFQLAIDGYGKSLIAKLLNAEGIPSFKSKTWATSSIDKILQNRAVLGEYQPYSVQATTSGKREPKGEPIKDYYPVLIDESTFYQAHAAIQGRKVSRSTKQSKRFNLWQGLAKCGACGSALHLVDKGKPPRGNTYLHCFSARKGLCKAKAIRLDKSEMVFREILAKVDSLALVQDSSGKLNKQLAEVEGRLSEQRTKLAEYKDGLRQHRSTVLMELVVEAEQAIATLESEQEALKTLLSSEQITSKIDFFERLDLQSYDGRYRANALLKRLKILVYAVVLDKDLTAYVAEQHRQELLALGDSKLHGIYDRPLSADQVQRKSVLDFDGTMNSSYAIFVGEVQFEDGEGTLTDDRFVELLKEMFARMEQEMPDSDSFKATLPTIKNEILGN